MASKKKSRSKELEIVSLIDVIFLLIIFGIVMSVLKDWGEKEVKGPEDIFTIQILRESQSPGDKEPPCLLVNISNSDENNTLFTEKFPPDDELLKKSPAAFNELPACVLIKDRISYYSNTYVISEKSENTEHIYVKVCPDAKLRVINFIIKELSPYNKTISWLRLGTT